MDSKQIEDFDKYLDKRTYLSKNSKQSYLFTLKQFCEKYRKVNKDTLQRYKLWLIENYKPQTVNTRIRGINCYLESIGKETLKLPSVKIQQKIFLENVISQEDYTYLKNCLKEDNNLKWYFVVRFLGATGARVSELIQFKIEHVKAGYIDLYSKGGKLRRIYIPKSLREETLEWLNDMGRESGLLFINRYGKQITTRGISSQLKAFAKKYALDTTVIYPHSFRHRFAKNFLEKNEDIAFLADLMGHENIQTTRIYLRKSSMEQREIIDNAIDW